MIFQQFNLVPRLDVLTNVLLGRISRHGTLPSLFKRFTDAERAMAVEALDVSISSRTPFSAPKRCRAASNSASRSRAR